jgi:hypothetical protein
LILGIVGNWHVHAFETDRAGDSVLAGPVQDHPDGIGCPACSLGQATSGELRPAISSVFEQAIDRATTGVCAIPASAWSHADPSRAPPVRL